MNPSVRAGSRLWPVCISFILILIPGACAFTITPVTLTPSDILNPGDPVNLSCTVYAASGVAFPSYDDIQLVTDLEDPVWSYTILVNGVENVRPAERGRTLTISGFELSYENKDEVIVRVALKARVPATAPLGAERMILKVQELDARSNVIATSVVRVDHLIGRPTPTPTPAFGSIAVSSDPSGAGVYLDNAIKGITPVVIDGVPNGAHQVLVRLEGYQDYPAAVTVMAGQQQVSAVLVPRSQTAVPASPSASGTAPVPVSPASTQSPPALTTGSLSVTTSPPGAIVYIDGQMKGITPATIPGLSGGNHAITLIMDGYEDFKTTTEITPGTTSEFITGLSKRKQTPGFGSAGAAVSLVLGISLLQVMRRKG